ncbi:MAG: NAD(+)/NADH kinase [Chloroflexota bacterium]
MINTEKNIAVLAHPLVEHSKEQAVEVCEYLLSKGASAVSGYLNDEGLRHRVEQGEFSLVITLGGDGTVLRAGHLCAPVQVPILPINMGSFGFLIELSLDNWRTALDRLLMGDYWIEDRMMLRTKVWRGDECLGSWDVLNETAIARGENLRPVHLSASLDGEAVTVYVADALIVATPTGSTAYALAAGGPILPPTIRNILLLPVAPHLSIDRAIVLAEGSTVNVEVLSDHGTIISPDGQASTTLEQGDRVEVFASEYVTSLVRFQEGGYFYKNLVSLMDQNPSVGGNR